MQKNRCFLGKFTQLAKSYTITSHYGRNKFQLCFHIPCNFQAGIGHYRSLAAAIPRDWRCVILSPDNIHPMDAINFINNTDLSRVVDQKCVRLYHVQLACHTQRRKRRKKVGGEKFLFFCREEEEQGRKNRRKMRKILGDLTNIQQYKRVRQYCNQQCQQCLERDIDVGMAVLQSFTISNIYNNIDNILGRQSRISKISFHRYIDVSMARPRLCPYCRSSLGADRQDDGIQMNRG